MAGLVTIADAVLAFPIAYYMARVASPRARNLLVVAVLMPLWASYLVKAYAWRTILSGAGVLNWALDPFGVSFDGYSTTGLWLVFTYLWLPFMILPIYAGLERIPSLAARGVRRPRREVAADVLPRDAAARVPGRRGRLDLHLLAHARRLHRAEADHEPAVHRHGDLRQPRHEPAGRGGVHARADRGDGRLPARGPAAAAPSRRSDGRVPSHAHPAAARRRADARLHLPAADPDRALRVQRERHAELADRRLHDEVVLDRLSRRGRAAGALAVGARGARRDRGRPGARDAGLARGLPLRRSSGETRSRWS